MLLLYKVVLYFINKGCNYLEYWDLYDKNRKPLNKTHQRGIPLNDDEYHIVVSIITVNSKKQILITRRAPTKEIYPNLWENTGGSVISGETSLNAALRELFEETGITALKDELIKIDTLMGTRKGHFAFVDIYMLKKDIEIDKLKMQPGETTEAKWVTFKQFEEMAEKGEVSGSTAKRLEAVKGIIEKNM
ncbi:MAG: NUDIX domain-containing protein [Clostridiales bacterium]|nr:NUDIX domain-containing protein [Clostridiales bacterium]